MKYTFLTLITIFIFACANEPESKDINSDTTVEIDIIPFSNVKESIETDIVLESAENIEEDIELQNDSSGFVFAKFVSASMVEAEIGLHFVEIETGKEINFYYFDIDLDKENLFSYKENTESIFPELVTNPEIKDVTLKIYWKIENRHIDLADEDADVKVLKKIERVKKNIF